MTTTYESPTPAATTSGTCTSTPTSFFLVLDGQFDVVLREAGGERTVSLRQGDLFVVPKGTEHKPSSPGGSIPDVRAVRNRDHRGPPRGRDSRPCRQHHRPGPRRPRPNPTLTG